MDKEIRNFLISLNIKDPDILEKTPQRFINFLTENCFGYKFDLSTILKDKRGIFQNGGKNNSIEITAIPFTSLCRIHLFPYTGNITISYEPKLNILGISKLTHIINIFSKQLTVQESLTEQIKDFLVKIIDPYSLCVEIEAEHLCKCNNVTMITKSTYQFTNNDSLFKI